MKLCRRCQQEKPLSEFGVVKSSPDGHRHACKVCSNAMRRKWRQGAKEKISAQKQASWYQNHEENKARMRARYPKVWVWKLKREYGMTPGDYFALLERQGGRCAVCGVKRGRQLCVDHCHKTGKIRGLLCSRCNRAIGMLDDDLPGIMNAAAYLQRHEASSHQQFGSVIHAGQGAFCEVSVWQLGDAGYCRLAGDNGAESQERSPDQRGVACAD